MQCKKCTVVFSQGFFIVIVNTPIFIDDDYSNKSVNNYENKQIFIYIISENI